MSVYIKLILYKNSWDRNPFSIHYTDSKLHTYDWVPTSTEKTPSELPT